MVLDRFRSSAALPSPPIMTAPFPPSTPLCPPTAPRNSSTPGSPSPARHLRKRSCDSFSPHPRLPINHLPGLSSWIVSRGLFHTGSTSHPMSSSLALSMAGIPCSMLTSQPGYAPTISSPCNTSNMENLSKTLVSLSFPFLLLYSRSLLSESHQLIVVLSTIVFLRPSDVSHSFFNLFPESLRSETLDTPCPTD